VSTSKSSKLNFDKIKYFVFPNIQTEKPL